MNNQRKLLTPTRIVELERRLSQIPEVAKFDIPGESQGHTLAHALDGWEDSFTEILGVLLPELVNPNASSDDLNDTLHKIGDELRHILYHIHDAKYFRYLLDH